MGLGFVHEPITLLSLPTFQPHIIQYVVSQHGYLTFDLSIAQKRCSTWLWTADIHILKYTNLTGVLGQDVICWTFRHKCCRRPRQNFSLRVPLIINYIALIPSQYKMYLVCYALHYRRKRACRTVQPFDYFRSAEIGQILISCDVAV